MRLGVTDGLLRIMSVSISVGTRFPAFATSLGRILLAAQSEDWLDDYFDRVDLTGFTERTLTDPRRLRDELARARKRGWAIVDQELEEGIRSVSVPIRDGTGGVAAAMNVSVHASRWTLDDVHERLLPRLQTVAALIERDARAPAHT